jgi:hypothetical protein
MRHSKTLESVMKQDTRPVLIGMNNPVSSEPSHALFPHPEGCTGHRLYEMLRSRVPHVTKRSYLNAFDRRNLVPFKTYSATIAKKCAMELEQEFWGSGRTIVLLGLEVVKAFGHPRSLIHPQLIGGATWRQIPHPSGRNLWYNAATNSSLVGCLLEDLFNASREVEAGERVRGLV